MIDRVIALSVRNRTLVLLLTAALLVVGLMTLRRLRLDAIPDLSDVQVIVVTEYPGQNPQVVDDQVTYPLASAMLAVPGATDVRGYSMFELSFVYVLFEDRTDIYWARSRVLEYLNFARDRLPQGVEPKLGPDATGVGWVYQYVLYPGWYCPDHPRGLWHDERDDRWYPRPDDAPSNRREALARVRAFEQPGACPLGAAPLVAAAQDLSQLRSLQDWYLRYPLTAVPGVAEVAAIGGFVRQYQVVLRPEALQAHRLPLAGIVDAIRRSNEDVGGATIELAEHEYMVRSRGYLRGLDDLGAVVVGTGDGGTPILLRDVATLAEVIADALLASREVSTTVDVGAADLLERYAAWRAADRGRVSAFTHGLIELFGEAAPGVGLTRGLGLMAFDLIPGAKALLARQTMGKAGRLPRLARGLPLLGEP